MTRLRDEGRSPLPALAGLYSLEWRAVRDSFAGQSLAFKLACLYLVLEYVRPQSVWPVLDFLPWTQLTIVLGTLAVAGDIGRRGLVTASSNFQIILFSLVVAASIFTAYSPSWSLDRLDVYFPWLVVYFFLVNAVAGRVAFFLFLLVFLVCSFKMSQHGFRSWAGSGFGFRSWGVTGAPGFFQNSGEVGIQMCVFLPMGIMFLVGLYQNLSWVKRVAVALLPLTAIGTIIASSSRGAVLGAVAALLWLVLIGRSKIKTLVVTALVMGASWLVLPPEFSGRFSAIGSDSTSLARFTYWRDGIDMVMKHPVLGVGFENWIPYYAANYRGLEGYYHSVQVSHNIFIQAAAELGLVGLAVFALMIATTFVLNARTRGIAKAADDKFLIAMASGLDAAMIGFLVSAQFVTVLYYPYFWVGMPLAVMLYTAAREAAGIPFSSKGRMARARLSPGGTASVIKN